MSSNSQPQQLTLSYGRPLRALAEEVRKSTRSQLLRRATEQMLESLDTIELADRAGVSKSAKTKSAICEILSK